MNAKLLLKTIFLIAILLLLVIMGMNNRQLVRFTMPLILPKPQELPAATYFAFFAIGLLSGTILSAGKKGGSAKPKAEK